MSTFPRAREGRPATASTPYRTSGMAVAGLACGLAGLCTCGLSGIIGLILSALALRRIRASQGYLGGRGLAAAGLALSIVTVVLGLLLGGGAIAYFVSEDVADQVREIIRNAQGTDDEPDFISEPEPSPGGVPLSAAPAPGDDGTAAVTRVRAA